MKRKFLEELGLEKEAIDSIMAENGKDIEAAKGEVDTLHEEVDRLKDQLGEANKQIESFKEMDVEGIKKAADDWQKKAEQAEKDAAARIAEMEHDSLLRESLSGMKFTSEYAKKGVFDEIKAKGLKVENGKILGLDDVISEIKGEKADAFVVDDDDKAPAFSKHTQGGSSPSSDQDIRAIMGLSTET